MKLKYIKLEINIIKFIKPGILPFITFIFFFLAFIPLVIYTYDTEKQFAAWSVAIVWICFISLPPIILQINYYINDRNTFIEVNNLEQLVIISRNKNKQYIKYDEIEIIEKYHSKNTEDGFVFKMHWHPYYYYKIIIKDKTPVIISRLITEKLEKKIEGVKFKFIRIPYPFIRKS